MSTTATALEGMPAIAALEGMPAMRGWFEQIAESLNEEQSRLESIVARAASRDGSGGSSSDGGSGEGSGSSGPLEPRMEGSISQGGSQGGVARESGDEDEQRPLLREPSAEVEPAEAPLTTPSRDGEDSLNRAQGAAAHVANSLSPPHPHQPCAELSDCANDLFRAVRTTRPWPP